MRQPYVVPRRRLLIAVWLTVLALPILVLDNIPRTDARAAQVAVAAGAPAGPTVPIATVGSAPPTPAADVTPAAPESSEPAAAAPTPTTTAAKDAGARSTASTASAPPTTPRSAPDPEPSPNAETGGASWYDYNSGECAHRTIPKGTVVTVTRLDTGASTTCVVTDRGPFGSGRVIDLDRSTFARLASPDAGLIQVRLSW